MLRRGCEGHDGARRSRTRSTASAASSSSTSASSRRRPRAGHRAEPRAVRRARRDACSATPTFDEDELARLKRETRGRAHRGARQRSRARDARLPPRALRRPSLRRAARRGTIGERRDAHRERRRAPSTRRTSCSANVVVGFAGRHHATQRQDARRRCSSAAARRDRASPIELPRARRATPGATSSSSTSPSARRRRSSSAASARGRTIDGSRRARRRERGLRRHVHLAPDARGPQRSAAGRTARARASRSTASATRSRCGPSPPATDAAPCLALELELLEDVRRKTAITPTRARVHQELPRPLARVRDRHRAEAPRPGARHRAPRAAGRLPHGLRSTTSHAVTLESANAAVEARLTGEGPRRRRRRHRQRDRSTPVEQGDPGPRRARGHPVRRE